MRSTSAINKPSFVNDLGSLAGLYRTVFWMIGRKAQYGRIWPREADPDDPEAATLVLRCEGPAAIEIQHLAGVIIEREGFVFADLTLASAGIA